jgi:hypothetical protein
LLGNEDLRIRLANAANGHLRRFTWERSTDLLEDFLIRVVQDKRVDQNLVSYSN